MLKCFLKTGNNRAFGLSQETTKVQCMYFAFKNLEIRTKKGQQWSEGQKESTNDVLRV